MHHPSSKDMYTFASAKTPNAVTCTTGVWTGLFLEHLDESVPRTSGRLTDLPQTSAQQRHPATQAWVGRQTCRHKNEWLRKQCTLRSLATAKGYHSCNLYAPSIMCYKPTQ
eukprot:650135-Pleurochrysis_carterae.AAC.1